jgi:hypothetical protein
MLILFNGSQYWRIALVGILCGITASFTQSKGATVTAGFLIYLIWQSLHEQQQTKAWRRVMLLCGAALLAFLAINGPYIAALGIKEWIKWVVIFPVRYYPTLPAQTWRSPLDDFRNQTGFIRWICIPFVYLTIPLVYLVFLRVMHRRRRIEPDQPWNQLLLLAITGFAMFVAVAPCLSVMRVSSASLPGMILLAWLLNRGGGKGRVAAATLAALSVAIAVYLPIRNQTMHWHYLDLPASIAAIENNRIPLLLLKPYRNLAGTWGYTDQHLRPFQSYLDQHYRHTKTFPAGFEVWQRRDSPQPELKP